MASLQAHLSVWIIKWRVKRKLRGVRDYRIARKILRPDPYKVPSNVRISSAQLNGVSGEWLDGPQSTNRVLLYLHGGGFFGCSAETHRPITASFARLPRSFRRPLYYFRRGRILPPPETPSELTLGGVPCSMATI